MAASFHNNSVHVDFESALAMGEPGMVSMFQALIASGLQGFLGCTAVVYEDALVEFFANGTVRDDLVVSTVNGVAIEFSEKLFTETFDLPVDGLADISEMPKDKIFDARSIVSLTGEPVTLSGLKSQIKMHYRLLCDIMAKSVSVKAGSFNAITVENFSLLTAVVCDVKMNWGSVLFGILKKMVTPGTKQAKEFAIQISLLLESVPNLELGESSEFPSSKILTDKTIHRYITVIDKSGAQEPADAPKVKKAPRTKVASKKRPADIPLDVPVVKRKRTSKKKSTLKLVAVAQEAIPIHIVPAESAVEPMVEDQQAQTEDAANLPAAEEETPADRPAEEIDVAKGDRVGTWFDRALAKEIATASDDSPTEKVNNEEIQWFVRPFLSADHDNERLFETGSDSATAMDFEVHSQNLPVVKNTYVEPTGEQEIQVFEEQLEDSVNEEELQDENVQSAEAKIDKDEAMSLDDLILSIPADIPVPYASIEITKIKMGTKIQIPGVDEKLCYLASLSQITDDDKGKALLVDKDPVKGHPAREHYSSICANIDLLVKLREKIIEDVDQFFQSFSFKKLASINVDEMSRKEELVLSWGETESIHEALSRKRYILLKYREMLVRKFLESWKKNCKPSEGTSATDLQVIDMLWERHLDVLQEFSKKVLAHGILWDRPCCSAIFEGSPRDRGAIIARTNTNTPSRCWIRTMIYVNGEWTVEPCADRWVKIPQMVFSNEVPRQRQYDDTLPPVHIFYKTLTKRWADICLEVVDFCASRSLLPVDTLQFCRSLPLVEPVFRVAPSQSQVFTLRVSQFCSVFVDFSVFSWIPTTDISDFLSSIALERTALRGVQRSFAQLVVPSVQLSLDQRPSSPTSADSSSSLHFDASDLDAAVSSLPSVSPDISAALADFQAILSEQVNESQSSISSRLHKIEQGLRDSLCDQAALFKNLFQEARQEGRTIADVQTLRFNEFRKHTLAQNASIFTGLADVRKEVQEVNPKVDILASRLNDVQKDVEATKEAISHQLFEFQSQAQENQNILHAQLSELVDYIHRGGADTKGGKWQPRTPTAFECSNRRQCYKSAEAFFREISRSIISADVFVKRRVSRQLQFPLVPLIGVLDRKEPTGALLDNNHQVHYLRETSRQLQWNLPAGLAPDRTSVAYPFKFNVQSLHTSGKTRTSLESVQLTIF
ncbi:hypothetical protein F511_34773 [Dorcoceras hygrometricum]|uniref:Dystroglycan-like n=1 Tax=Dorcoceras hygrometricum TaxID=472368 RepID=A0A2Z7AV84_9LAMI|nr:hypothetical protein F511_34773 [Dorcoceras hygrometricum]